MSDNDKNIVLTGFMGSGKTTVGRIIAQRLGRVLVDSDEEIEKACDMTISNIFSIRGEHAFRDIETNTAERLSGMSNLVISTGGGIVIREQNTAYLKRNGVVFCLMAAPQTILLRTAGDESRPLLNVDNPLEVIEKLLGHRRVFYLNADVVVDTDEKTPEEVASIIIDSFNSKCSK